MRIITTPLGNNQLETLQAGEMVLVSGVVYTARDAAHARMVAAMDRGERLPFALEGQIIYYAGPCPAPPGRVIGSCGPTTSSRMDVYAPRLMEGGIRAMIGKGERSPEVAEAIRKHGAVYLATIGGAGALLSERVKSAQTIAYQDLGPEAVMELQVDRLPCVVAIDSNGVDVYRQARKRYRKA